MLSSSPFILTNTLRHSFNTLSPKNPRGIILIMQFPAPNAAADVNVPKMRERKESGKRRGLVHSHLAFPIIEEKY